MGYSKHELITNKHAVFPKKIVILHPYLPITATSQRQPLSSVPKVATMERFNCMQFFCKVE